jgi:hypothetical protein
MRRTLLLLTVGLTLIGLTDTAAATSGSAAPPSTIAAPEGYRTVVDDTGVVSVAIPIDWIAETTPHVTPEGLYVPRIAAGRDAARPVPGCDGCGMHIPLPMFSITVSPYEPVSPEAPPGCDALEVIPFDSDGFTGRREIGGGCDVSGEWILASRPGAFTVRIGLIYADSATGPLTEEDRAAAAAVFETVLATFAWTGRPYEEVTAVGLPSAATTAPAPTAPAPNQPPAGPTLCVLADIDFAAVRSAPGTGNPEVGRIPPGTCGVVAVASDQSTGEEWLHVQYDGIDGWSAARLYVPDAPPPTAPPPTAPPAVPASGVDLSNAEIPALCGFPAGRLVNGELRVEEVPPDSFMGARLASQVEGDVDGDGVPEVAAEFICTGGGDVFWQAVAVFRNDLTPIGAFDVEEMAIPGFAWTSAAIESLTWDAGRFRIDAAFSASASDSRSTSAWLSVVDGVLHPSLAGEGPDPVGGGPPVSSGLWTFDGDWLDAVPQLGTEPVRGSGCGADGSIGDVIPDGWWFGLVRSSDGAQFGFTLACAYYGESARPFLEQCDPDVCVWDESIMPVFPADRIWNVPTRPDIVKELTAACAANAAELEEQSLRDGRNIYSWIHVTAGQADYVRHACPMG